MGRQILFHMLPDDCAAFAAFLTKRDPVVFTFRDSNSPEIQTIADPCPESKTISLWNRSLLPGLKREYIEHADSGPYYRVDDSQPVLELSTSRLAEWEGLPGLLQGRIWGAFKATDPRYAAWFNAIVRWIRKNYVKGEILGGYVAPAVQEWRRRGGLLLPMFIPPPTDEWRALFESQLASTKAPDQGIR